jgi:hypothetical protein
MMDRLARAMRSRVGVSPWVWAVRPPAGMLRPVGALTVVTGPGGQDMPTMLIADTRRTAVLTLVRTGEEAVAAQPYLAAVAASNAITRISVEDSKRFASAWNEICLR